MIPDHLETFEEFLKRSFAHGVYSRELRLSREEAGYILKKHSTATLKKCLTPEISDEKNWYEVHLMPPMTISHDMAAIQHENLCLKQELEALKKNLVSLK